MPEPTRAELLAEIAALRKSLVEAFAQQTATSEILHVISRSPAEVQPVFETIVRNAMRLCGPRRRSRGRERGAVRRWPHPARRARGPGCGCRAIHQHNCALANMLRGRLGVPPGDSAIVTVAADEGLERLRAAGIKASVRAGAVRVSFHLHNTGSDVNAVARAFGY